MEMIHCSPPADFHSSNYDLMFGYELREILDSEETTSVCYFILGNKVFFHVDQGQALLPDCMVVRMLYMTVVEFLDFKILHDQEGVAWSKEGF